jgi:hypothetical protein
MYSSWLQVAVKDVGWTVRGLIGSVRAVGTR